MIYNAAGDHCSRSTDFCLRLIIVFAAFAVQTFITPNVNSQDKTQYLLHEIPQTLNLNPAIQYECRSFIELPIISEIQAYYRNNGFSYHQAFTSSPENGGDSLMLNPDRLSQVLGRRNHLRLGTGLGLLGFGFRRDDWYFSVNLSNLSAFRVTFERSILDARDGNWDLTSGNPRQISLNGTGIHFIDYTELAFGASKKVYEGFYIGGRVKILMGAAHLQTKRSRIDLNTNLSPIELSGRSDLQLRASMPVQLSFNNEGHITNINSLVTGLNDLPAYLISGNLGIAIDAGVIYELNDRLTLSASVNDFGFIRWRRDVNVLSEKDEFLFNGFNLNNYVNGGTETDLLQALQDSIAGNFMVSESGKPYFAPVPLKMFAGSSYALNSYFGIGNVVEVEILSGRIYPGFTIMAYGRPYEGLTLTLSYSLMDRAYNNLGFGLVAGNNIVQFYLVSDHIPLNYVSDRNTGLFWPYNSRTMNIRFGVNILMGCQKDRRPGYRRPGRNKYCPAYQ